MTSKVEPGYDQEFFAKIMDEGHSSARVIAPYLVELFSPSSVVDVGCGTGAWLQVFKELGVERIQGLDGSWVERKNLQISTSSFLACDLSTAWPVTSSFDLALCLEVAEHLPADRSAFLVQQLVALAPIVVFSAALPGQGGTGHVNERWPAAWRALFAQRGFLRLDPIRRRVWQDPAVAWYYQQNIFVFVEEALVTRSEMLRRERRIAESSPLTLIREELLARPGSLRTMIRHLRNLLTRAIKTRVGTASQQDRPPSRFL